MLLNGKIKIITFVVALAFVFTGCQSNNVVTTTAENTGGAVQITVPAIESLSHEQKNDLRAKEILDTMSLSEKVYQMFFVTPEALTGVSSVSSAGDATKNALANYPVGGIIYFSPNIKSLDQVKDMTAKTKSYSKYGIFLATDEEGGVVRNLAGRINSLSISSMYSYKNQGNETAKTNASLLGGELVSAGLNVDFAPVADVLSNPNNSVIGSRAYSNSFEDASSLISSAVEGFHAEKCICTLKHFPGHGNTSEDSHAGLAYNRKSKDELMKQELLPFISGINAGADMVMMGHIVVPDIDSNPASISHSFVTDILRNELEFGGVIITDSLQMNAVSNTYGSGELAVKVVEAGNDMILMPVDFHSAYNGVMDAISSGRLSEERINESVMRILKLKIKYGIVE